MPIGFHAPHEHELSTREAAERFAVSEQSVRRAIARGQLVARKHGSSYRIPLAAMHRFHAMRLQQGRSAVRRVEGIADEPPHGLPVPLTPLVGRTREVQEVTALIRKEGARLVTITGPGGVGKTRLALASATELREHFADGAYFVDVSSIDHVDLVSATIVHALGLPESGDRPILEYLISQLHGQQILLVLDNMEHVLRAGREVVKLLESCPDLVALATSRIALRVSGEHVYPLLPLAVPNVEGSADRWSVANLEKSDAGRLFALRARAARGSFDVTPANAPAIAELCHRLDGLPLAIELAAARCAALSPEALLERMDRPLTMLSKGPQDAPARMQSLGEAIAWSYDLLTFPEQCAFRWLSVFAGGFTIGAAEALLGSMLADNPAGDTPVTASPFDVVMSLHAQSLLTHHEQADGSVRFHMLETIRAFALDQLQRHGEEGRARYHSATQLVERVERADRVVPRPDRWWIPFEAEWANLRAALQWTIDARRTGLGLRLGSELFGFWMLRGQIGEGIAWLEQLVEAGDEEPVVLRARGMMALGFLHWTAGNLDRADTLAVAAMLLEEAGGDVITTAASTFLRGFIAEARGDLVEALRLLHCARSHYERASARSGANAVLGHIGRVLFRLGKLGAARDALTFALPALNRTDGNHWGAAMAMTDFGLLLAHEGDLPGAAAMVAQALRVQQSIGDRLTTVISLAAAAAVLAAAERPSVVTLLAAVEAMREQCGASMWAVAARAHADAVSLAQPFVATSRPGRPGAPGHWQPGDVVVFALAELTYVAEGRQPPEIGSGIPRLSPRELEVLRLIARGQTDREIAEQLDLDVRTVNTYVANARRKLGAPSRTAAVAAMWEYGLA
jgi:excisionase family DNA binding protein